MHRVRARPHHAQHSVVTYYLMQPRPTPHHGLETAGKVPAAWAGPEAGGMSSLVLLDVRRCPALCGGVPAWDQPAIVSPVNDTGSSSQTSEAAALELTADDAPVPAPALVLADSEHIDSSCDKGRASGASTGGAALQACTVPH